MGVVLFRMLGFWGKILARIRVQIKAVIVSVRIA
jgi:hypothetical protein